MIADWGVWGAIRDVKQKAGEGYESNILIRTGWLG